MPTLDPYMRHFSLNLGFNSWLLSLKIKCHLIHKSFSKYKTLEKRILYKVAWWFKNSIHLGLSWTPLLLENRIICSKTLFHIILMWHTPKNKIELDDNTLGYMWHKSFSYHNMYLEKWTRNLIPTRIKAK